MIYYLYKLYFVFYIIYDIILYMRKGQKKGDYKMVKLTELSGNSTLTEDILTSVEEMMMEGIPVREIYETLGIPRSTWNTWITKNTAGFEDFFVQTRRKAILSLAEKNILELQNSKDEKIKLDASKFASERLGKQWYSTRSETKQIEKQETLEDNEQERIDKLLQKSTPQNNITSPFTKKAL